MTRRGPLAGGVGRLRRFNRPIVGCFKTEDTAGFPDLQEERQDDEGGQRCGDIRQFRPDEVGGEELDDGERTAATRIAAMFRARRVRRP